MAVGDAEQPIRRDRISAKTVGLIASFIALYGAWTWFRPPSGASSGFYSLQTETSVGCDVTHDGFPYPAHQDSFRLVPGETFTGRFGPHDVRVSFLNEADERGLEIRTASRTFFGMGTTGISTGNEDGQRVVEEGFALGTLVIDCRH